MATKRGGTKKATGRKYPERVSTGHGPKKGESGRPCILTDEMSAAICAEVEKGAPLKYAALLGGTTYSTMSEWIARANRPDEKDPRFERFKNAIELARAKRTRSLVQSIIDAGTIPSKVTDIPDWRAHAWILERTEQDLFGPRSKTEISGPEGKPLMNLADLVGAAADRLNAIEDDGAEVADDDD